MFDSGAISNFISENLAKSLRLGLSLTERIIIVADENPESCARLKLGMEVSFGAIVMHPDFLLIASVSIDSIKSVPKLVEMCA